MDKAIILTIISLAAFTLAYGFVDFGICDGLPPNEIYLFPHERNCSLFYQCLNGQLTLELCPSGLFYNNRTQSCDFTEPSYCNHGTAPTTAKPHGDPRCVGVNNDYFPHFTDCTKYIECYKGDSYLMSCPNGYFFDEKRKLCVHPDVADCKAATSTSRTSTTRSSTTSKTTPKHTTQSTKLTPTTSKPTTPSPKPSTPKPTTKPTSKPPTPKPTTKPTSKPPTKPPTKPSTKPPTVTTAIPTTTPHPLCWGVRPGQIVLKPAEGDCGAYWRCDGADLSAQHCPQYLFFNEALQLCDFPDKVKCDQSTATPTSKPTSPGPSPSTPKVPDPRCRNQTESFWPDPIICSRYIECHKGKSYELDCPLGLHFNGTLSKCIEERFSECGKITTTPRSTTKDPDFTKHPDCPEDGRYLFPHPGDCTKYDECAEGVKIVRDCPGGLWFNPVHMICDYPYQSGCKNYFLSFLDFGSWFG